MGKKYKVWFFNVSLNSPVMSEVLNSSFDALNVSGNVSEKIWEIPQEDLVRVTEQAQKAQQVARQIIQSKQDNAYFAQFLKFLIQKSELDDLFRELIKVFFVDQWHHQRVLDPQLLWGFFVPFYVEKVEELYLGKFYEQFGEWRSWNISSYVVYLKHLFQHFAYHTPEYIYLQEISQDRIVDCVFLLTKYYGLVSNQLDSEKTQLLRESLKKEFF